MSGENSIILLERYTTSSPEELYLALVLIVPWRELHDRPPGTVSDYTHHSESSKSNVGPR